VTAVLERFVLMLLWLAASVTVVGTFLIAWLSF
jgi:hypothetical protein